MATLGMPICMQHDHTATQRGHKLQAPGSHPAPFLHATRRFPLDSPRAQSCTVCQRPTTLGWVHSPHAPQPLGHGCSPAFIDASGQRPLLGISCNLLRSVANTSLHPLPLPTRSPCWLQMVNISACLLAKMMAGTVTTWDHPDVLAINPNLSVAPGARITVRWALC